MKDETDRKQLRAFGLLVGGIFLLIGLWPTMLYREDPRLWALAIAGLLLIPALVLPRSLGPVYRGWMAIGHVLGWINTRIILGLVFYGLFTPMGVVRRLVLGKDAMRRKFEPDAETYRIVRSPRSAAHLRHQF
jgi:polyferredoxin